MSKKMVQVLAQEKQIKARADLVITAAYQNMQKPDLLKGHSKTYEPLAEAVPSAQGMVGSGELPPELMKVRLKAPDALAEVAKALADLFVVTAEKDTTNCAAKADVEIDGKVLMKDAPATYLLWVEKQLTQLKAVIEKLPILDPAYEWRFDPAKGHYVTDPVKRQRQEKIQEPLVLVQATKEHPAQSQMITKDRLVGYWTHVEFSGALPVSEVKAMVERMDKLTRAVKSARAEANGAHVVQVLGPEDLVKYIFQGQNKDLLPF